MSVSLGSLVIILAFLATTAFAIVAALWMARRRRDQELRAHGSPLLVMSSGDITAFAEASAAPRPAPVTFATVAAPPNEVRVHAGPIEDPVTATTGRFAPGAVAAEVVHGHSLRFHRPPDGTLQFFPASFHVIGGPDAGHELRFVHPDPGVSPDITFGRKEGPPYRHVQLLEPTVSRTHARLSRDGSGWRVVNLSRTNPVVVNGEPITGVDTWHRLADGDLVEMGALVFRYHAGEPAGSGR
jgi:hypothetical protein